MGKYVKTLVVKRQAPDLTAHDVDEDYSELLSEIERVTEIVSEQPAMAARRQQRRTRNPLLRTRSHCVRELKVLFGAYLSGDYERDSDSAMTLGQIHAIGEMLDREQPEVVA